MHRKIICTKILQNTFFFDEIINKVLSQSDFLLLHMKVPLMKLYSPQCRIQDCYCVSILHRQFQLHFFLHKIPVVFHSDFHFSENEKCLFCDNKCLWAFICADVSLSDVEIFTSYVHRWNIEVFFHSIKKN